MFNSKKVISIITLIICLIFIILSLYGYFILKRASLQILILTILFFGIGIVGEIVSLVSKHEGWFVKRQDLSKKQNILMAICVFVFAICQLLGALIFNIHIFLKTILFIGFLFFSVGSVIFLIKQIKQER